MHVPETDNFYRCAVHPRNIVRIRSDEMARLELVGITTRILRGVNVCMHVGIWFNNLLDNTVTSIQPPPGCLTYGLSIMS